MDYLKKAASALALFFTAAVIYPDHDVLANDLHVSDQARFYGSEKTRKKIGQVADRITRWAGRPVLVLSALDFEEREEDGKITPEAVKKFILENTDFDLSLIKDRVYGEMARKLQNQEAAAGSFGQKSKNFAEFCIVTTGSLDETAEGSISAYSGIPPALLEARPGTNIEWFTITMQHEAAHCTDELKPSEKIYDWLGTTTKEIKADQGAVNINWGERHNPATPETAYIPYYVRLARAVGIVHNFLSPTHYVAAGVFLPGESPQKEYKNGKNYSELLMPALQIQQEKMAKIAGFNKYKVNWITAANDISEYVTGFHQNPKENYLDLDTNQLNSYIKANIPSVIDESNIKKFVSEISKYPDIEKTYYLFVGHALKTNDPESYRLGYLAALEALQDRSLNIHPAGRKLLQLYVEGLETFIPSVVTPDKPKARFIPVTSATFKPYSYL